MVSRLILNSKSTAIRSTLTLNLLPSGQPFKLYAQDILRVFSDLNPVVYSPADYPQYLFGRTNQWYPVSPGTGNPGVNHKVLELFGLTHTQRLKTVTLSALPHCQFFPNLIRIKAGSKAIVFANRFLHYISFNSPARQISFAGNINVGYSLKGR